MMKTDLRKILFIVQLPPPIHGAALMNSFFVNSQLLNKSFQCRVLENRFVQDIHEIGIFSVRKVWQMLVIFFKLLIILIRWRPQMVYLTLSPTGGAFLRDCLYVALIKLFRVKLVFHLHGMGITNETSQSGFRKTLARFAFRKTYVISLAKALEEDWKLVSDGTPSFILANGIPHYDFPPPVSNPVPVFLFLANLKTDKGILDYLHTLTLLHNKNLEFKSYIVGAPADISVEEVKAYIHQNGLADKVTVTGALYGDEKLKTISECDILVAPTHNDAFPLVMLEAMQAEKPVIASNVGGISEIIEDGITGFVLPSSDPVLFAEKMQELYFNVELRKQMGKNGKAKFDSCYTFNKCEETLFQIFNRILS